MKNDQRFYSLSDLKKTTDAVIASLDLLSINEGLNWRDIRCVEARESLNERGVRNYTVYIKEADYDAYDFQRRVMEGLHAAGFHGIEVETSW